MPRYVDADYVLENEEKSYRNFFDECESRTVKMYIRSVHEAFRQIVKRAATVRVAPVVYARWEINPDGYYPYCTACKKEPENGIMTDFCPHCGAKMKTDGDEGE